MARPLVGAIEKRIADVSSLAVIANGGALLTPFVKQRLIEVLPNVVVVDGVRSSVTGAQMTHLSTSAAVSTGTFNPGPDTFAVADDLGSILEPGHDGIGWLGQRGYVPLGYKGDAAKQRPPSRSSAVCGTRCLATGHAIVRTAPSNCWAAIR
jgi:3-oxocholest-4-en-26-oate---CoA ligase